MSALRGNSRLRPLLGDPGVEFLDWSLGAFERILRHAEVTPWSEINWAPVESVWASSKRTEIRVTIPVGGNDDSRAKALQATVRRRSVPVGNEKGRRVLDLREYDICKRIALRIAHVLRADPGKEGAASLRAIRDAFDEQIVADHLTEHHNLRLDLTKVFDAIHQLAEQTYENKALTFGVLLDPSKTQSVGEAVFPQKLFESKKYKALSDGFRTAYYVSTDGHLLDFLDLQKFGGKKASAKHYFPEWAEELAKSSLEPRCGIGLSRQGDVLVFDKSTLRFSYRYGQWQYWNHAHLLELLRNRARAQHVQPGVVGKIVASVYRAALDVSFRRSGGMFVLLRNRSFLSAVVPKGDELGAQQKKGADAEFDRLLQSDTIQSMPRRVLVELASLDGAVVVDNSGQILAYGSVLQPKKKGRLRGTEGSRTKAAIGASNYGLVIKVSADGDITVYHGGKEFLHV